MPPVGRWRRHKGQKMVSTSQPGPGVDDGAVCIVEAPESQGRTQQNLSCLLFLHPLIFLNNKKGSLRLKQSLTALMQRTLQKNVLILCVMINVETQVKL